MAYGINIDLRKTSKRNHIIDIFRERGDLSKIMAKNLSGYSMETIISIFDGLVEEELVLPSDGEQKTKGRRAHYFRLNDSRKVYLGVTFNQQGIRSSLVSFSGRLVDSYFEPLPHGTGKRDFIARLGGHIRSIVGRNASLRGSLSHVGVSVPGDVDIQAATLRSYIFMPSIAGIDFRRLIASALPGVEITVDHNINSMASSLLEDRGAPTRGERILFVSARTGTACALIGDGRIVTGHGELGHVRVTDGPELCPCGRTGCLDLYFSYGGFRDLLAGTDRASVAGGPAEGVLAALRKLCADENSDAGRELRKRLALFTSALMDAVNILSPDRVILTGELLGVFGDPAALIDRIAREQIAEGGYIRNFLEASFEYREMGTEMASIGICRDIIRREWAYSIPESAQREPDGG